MNYGPELLLVGAVATVGVLHTMVPDHWVPITLIARQRGWSKSETARAALQAGIGHVLSTLLIALPIFDSQRRFLLGRCSPGAASRAIEVLKPQKCSAISLPKKFFHIALVLDLWLLAVELNSNHVFS